MSRESITFESLTAADFPLIHRWLNDPEVAAWYGLGIENHTYPPLDEVVAHYTPHINRETPIHPFMMLVGGERIGYIQCYRIGDWPEYARAIDLDDDAWAIDLYIGKGEMRDRGLGAAILAAFVEQYVFTRSGVTACLINPNPKNARGIRCYEKAGFEYVKTVFVPEEGQQEYVMRVWNPQNASRTGTRGP